MRRGDVARRHARPDCDMTHDVTIEASRIPSPALLEYARIPSVFEVNAVLDVSRRGAGEPFMLAERAIDTPYLKDYDAIAGGPTTWAQRFDTSRWGLLVARTDGQCVGGVTVAHGTPGVEMLEGRSDLAVLWDIRIAAERRRHGIGTALFEAAWAWATTRGCRVLEIETQSINVAACRFYARQGCVLQAVNPGAYPGCPGEVQLLWYKHDPHRPAVD
jgi:GNAT superfamily N-acetyltransferase